jgi:rod shape-determining protein MreC
MIADYRYHQLGTLRHYLFFVVYPIHWAVDTSGSMFTAIKRFGCTYSQLLQENEQLKKSQFLQNARMQKFMALEAENKRLRALLQSSFRTESLLAAEVIRVNSDPFVHRVTLDKGSTQGVTIGQPVVDAEGVIGEVIEVYPSTSLIILLTDASYGISVENVRNGVRGVAVGTGSVKSLELRYVPNTMDLTEGDALVTSGLDGRYPPGYPVGIVSHIEYDPGESFTRVQIAPSARLEQSRQVLLVRN